VRTWQRNTSSLRVLATAIALVDAEPELAEMGPDGLPVAWRIFRPGQNESRNGPALFDEVAARLVMADYREHGARIQVDMDHVSLNKESKAYDPRGLGYHDLELREDGSLWACNAHWTERGAAMLRAVGGKAAELPYYSPAFDVDSGLQFGDEPDRVIYIFNGGLVGTPATDRPMALAAASRRKGQTRMNPKEALKLFRAMAATDRERLLQIWKLTDSQAELPSAKLAQLLKWQDGADDVDPKVLAKMVQAMGGDASQGIGGLMRQLRQFMEMAMKALMGEQPAPEAVPTEAEEAMAADNPEERENMLAARREQREELRILRDQAAEDRKELQKLRADRQSRELARRRHLVGQLVALNRETPATAWVDSTVKDPEKLEPRGSLATMPLAELEEKVKAFGGERPELRTLTAPAPQPAGGYTGAITQPGLYQMSEYEAKRLEIAAKRSRRSLAWATRRYKELRKMQCLGAKQSGRPEVLRVMARRYTDDRNSPDLRTSNLVLTDVTGVLDPDRLESFRKWASQAPVEQNAAVSIAAMREFDLVYNMAAATPGPSWAEVLGDIRPSGSIADKTFPLDFEEIFYEEKTDQATAHETPTLWSIDVRKKRYAAGAQASIELLNTPGSFDYMQETWLRKAERMATARWDLVHLLAVAILTGNPRLYQRFLDGKLEDLTGKDFFATDHPIHPFKKGEVEDVNGDTTWSNFEGSGTPFDRTNLTAQLTQFDLTPNTRGRFMRMPATHVVSPSALLRTVTNTISVQELLLTGVLTNNGDGTMGTESNEHIGSGLLPLEVEHLPGLDTTADWYLFSEERKRAGFVPYAVCESETERVFVYGPDTDFALDTGFIKERRETDMRVIPIHPQALRKIKGS
jgi:hypothetical protein